VAKVSSGTWSASTLVNADIDAAAAIAFSKMAALTASGVVTTNGSGVITASTTPLSRALGGTGVDLSAAIPQFRLLATNSAADVIDATLTYGTSATPNSLVQRDGSGIVALGSIDVSTITSPADLTFAPIGGDILFGTTITHWTASADADSWRVVSTVTTTNATATTLLAVPTTSGTVGRSFSNSRTSQRLLHNLVFSNCLKRSILPWDPHPQLLFQLLLHPKLLTFKSPERPPRP
jgi:hypothetical protein